MGKNIENLMGSWFNLGFIWVLNVGTEVLRRTGFGAYCPTNKLHVGYYPKGPRT